MSVTFILGQICFYVPFDFTKRNWIKVIKRLDVLRILTQQSQIYYSILLKFIFLRRRSILVELFLTLIAMVIHILVAAIIFIISYINSICKFI